MVRQLLKISVALPELQGEQQKKRQMCRNPERQQSHNWSTKQDGGKSGLFPCFGPKGNIWDKLTSSQFPTCIKLSRGSPIHWKQRLLPPPAGLTRATASELGSRSLQSAEGAQKRWRKSIIRQSDF